jgi:hypothetical protein
MQPNVKPGVSSPSKGGFHPQETEKSRFLQKALLRAAEISKRLAL